MVNQLGVIVESWLCRKMLFFTALYWGFGIKCHDVHNFIYSPSDRHGNPIERELLNRRNLKRVRITAKWPFVSLYWCSGFEPGIFSQILNKSTLKNYHIMCKKRNVRLRASLHPVSLPLILLSFIIKIVSIFWCRLLKTVLSNSPLWPLLHKICLTQNHWAKSAISECLIK